ncbi:MAG: hypothetical protein ABEJ03_06495 [Candidatus Nanohaloarchaea archaeon]
MTSRRSFLKGLAAALGLPKTDLPGVSGGEAIPASGVGITRESMATGIPSELAETGGVAEDTLSISIHADIREVVKMAGSGAYSQEQVADAVARSGSRINDLDVAEEDVRALPSDHPLSKVDAAVPDDGTAELSDDQHREVSKDVGEALGDGFDPEEQPFSEYLKELEDEADRAREGVFVYPEGKRPDGKFELKLDQMPDLESSSLTGFGQRRYDGNRFDVVETPSGAFVQFHQPGDDLTDVLSDEEYARARQDQEYREQLGSDEEAAFEIYEELVQEAADRREYRFWSED